ncbi:MAG: RNA polymerase sigma factor [Eubacteriales bacterium]
MNNFYSEELLQGQNYEDLYPSIYHLDHLHKIPVVLKCLEGFKEKEIAEILGINMNTLKTLPPKQLEYILMDNLKTKFVL